MMSIASLEQFGKIIGVFDCYRDSIGSGVSLKINARLIGTESASIFTAAATTFLKDGR